VSRIGKITIFVSKTANQQQISVRTTGQRGATLLNTISSDVKYNSQSPFDTAHNFWTDVLTKALTQI